MLPDWKVQFIKVIFEYQSTRSSWNTVDSSLACGERERNGYYVDLLNNKKVKIMHVP